MKSPIKLFIISLIISISFSYLYACNSKIEGDQNMNTINKAIDFTLKDQNKVPHRLSDYANQYVLIYFYPKDDTPGCTKEACLIRDNEEEFESRNIKVFGISADNPESHKKFIEKYHLPFTLLSDENKEVAKLYKADGVFLKRISYLIAPGGQILKFYPKVDPSSHAEEILADFDKLKDKENF
jgi:thioredoxin-dependent peroxiredoxin